MSRLVSTLLIALVVAAMATLSTPDRALAITRDTVLARGQVWVNNPVPYSQAKYRNGYRTDCSGYVSMVWQTGRSWSTSTMHEIANRITVDQLKPGDVLLKAGTHVRLFYGWVDDAHTSYVAYEQTGPSTKSSIKLLASDLGQGYIPYRYKLIADSPIPWNSIVNSRFDVWSNGEPVWWTYGRVGSGVGWQVRTGATGTAAFSLGLSNPNSSAATYGEARQALTVEPGKTYTLTTLAGTTADPSAIRVRVQVIDARGATVADSATTGDLWGIGPGALRPMSLSLVMPAGAARAVTSLRLSGSSLPSGTAVFDDVVLSVTSPLPVYRFYNRKNGSHFYTASGPERDVVANTFTATYTFEGVAYGVPSSAANCSPLYRFYNRKNGSHFYTASAAERDRVKSKFSATYTYEGPAYNVSETAVPGATPVYRFFRAKSGSHFYTASSAERDSVRAKYSASYKYEGIAFYVAP